MSGRPTTYTLELGKKICELLANGQTLRAIEKNEGMPARSTIAVWKKRYPEFRSALDDARQDHADALADEVVHIADTEKDPQKARNMIESRKWRSGVIKPREYGPRLDLTVAPGLDPAELNKQGMERVRRMRDPNLIPRTIDGETVLVPESTVKEPAKLTIWD